MGKSIAQFLAISVITVLCVEIALRIAGFEPRRPQFLIYSDPPGFIKSDSLFGYTFNKGVYRAHVTRDFSFNVKYVADGERSNPYLPIDTNLTVIHIYGCSFFGGWGVSDSAVMSSQLQLMLPRTKVRNFSLPGHGLTTQYMRFKQQLENGLKPDFAVFQMAAFHFDRNVAAPSFMRTFVSRTDYVFNFPKARIHEGELQIELVPFIRESPLSYHLAFWSVLESMDYRKAHVNEEAAAVIEEMVVRIIGLCTEYEVRPVFTFITDEDVDRPVKKLIVSKGLSYCSAAIDFHNPVYNLNPDDNHPNALGHRAYADSISKYFVYQIGKN